MSTTTPITPWRETAQKAAYEGAQAEYDLHGHKYPGLAAYRYEHIKAVVQVALRLAELTGGDPEIVEAAAWLHDVSKAHSVQHGIDSAIASREILASTDFPDKIDAVADAISKHVGLATVEPVEPLEAAILWDADKLTKLGVTIMIHSTALLLPCCEEVTTERLIDQWRDPEWGGKPVPYFNTEPARQAGRARLAVLRRFAEQAKREWNGDDLPSSAGGTT
jgi:uncharacterized protein